MYKKKSLFQKIKNVFSVEEDNFFDEEEGYQEVAVYEPKKETPLNGYIKEQIEEAGTDRDVFDTVEEICGELSVDVYNHENQILIQAMVAGVKPDSLEVTIGRDMVMIKGKREDTRKINDEDFYVRELYWGAFARTIALPEEIDPDLAEAVEKFGLLTLKLPKIDKNKKTNLKVKSV